VAENDKDVPGAIIFPSLIPLLGIVIGFALEWAFLLLIASLVLLHYGVVLREERYLERKFGDDYRTYKKSVPRYGFKL